MVYLFKKLNGSIVLADKQTAWAMYTSNGNWKHQPEYLGAVTDEQVRQMKEKIKKAVPIEDGIEMRVNTGNDKQADFLLIQAQKKREKVSKEEMAKLITEARKDIFPENMNVFNKDQVPMKDHNLIQGL